MSHDAIKNDLSAVHSKFLNTESHHHILTVS